MHRRGLNPRNATVRPRALASLVAIAALVIGVLMPVSAAASIAPVSTAAVTSAAAIAGPVKTTLAGFSAGDIMSDAVFTDKSTMTEAQIQSFFNSKVKTCRGGSDQWGPIVCLKDFRVDSVNRPADAYCKGYTGAKSETAARIIYRVAQSCNINPRVLIVMLQKEQSLVTHTWPSAWRYDKALGQGCPDDAACNPAYVGFFHQIYGAARQMQTYMEGKYFTWYAPGKTWNLLYHPNRACGTSPVYIANKATSALYYYTPYQPNAAALRAGYGSGDSCSSYGNRNFYNYFTDWFGSTRAPATSAPILQVGNDIYFVSGGNSYHITPEDWPEYRAVFGAPRVVSSLSAYRDRGDTTRFIRNSKTGVIAYLSEGEMHRFSSCAMVSLWGGDCYRRVEMTDVDFSKFSIGPEMMAFARTSAGGNVHQVSAGRLQPLYDDAAATDANGGSMPFAALMLPSQVSGFTIAPRMQFAAAQLLSPEGASEVYLATRDGRLLHVPAWELMEDIGLSRSKITVPTSAIAGFEQRPMSPIFECEGLSFAPSGSGLSELKAGNHTGLPSTVLDPVTCERLRISGSTVSGELFIRYAGTDQVLHVTLGATRHVPRVAQVRAITGGSYPMILTLRSGTARAFPAGPMYTAPATLVRGDGSPEVWLVDGDSLWHLPSWELATDFGLRRSVSVERPAILAPLIRRGDLSPVVTCEGVQYTASGGVFSPIAGSAASPATPLEPDTCAALGIG